MDINLRMPRINRPAILDEIPNKVKTVVRQLKNDAAIQSQLDRVRRAWIDVMANTNSYNNELNTYTLRDLAIEGFGYSSKVFSPAGLSLEGVEKLQGAIESYYGCLCTFKRKKYSKYMDVQFITKPIEDKEYEVITLKPWELYLGVGIDGKAVIVDMLKFPHLIDTGSTGMGKTKLIDCILTNLIMNCSQFELGLYLIQIDKGDQAIYRRCKQTRAYANDMEKALAVSNYLVEVVKKRADLLTPLIESGIGDNIYAYNKKYPMLALPILYVVIDEYSSTMPDERGDEKEMIAMKKKFQSNMDYIARLGRAGGVYIVLGLQRATVDKLPSFVKAMMNCNVSFRHNNARSSEVALGTDEAIYLDVREAILVTNEKYYLKTTTLTNKRIVELIDKYRIPERNYKDTFDYKYWINPTKKIEKDLEVGKAKNVEKVIGENIPGFVPYNPPSVGTTVIDMSKPNLQASEKPIRGGKAKNEVDGKRQVGTKAR